MIKKIWKAYTRQIIDGESVSIATEIKKDGERLIKKSPQRRGFVAFPETKDAFSIYMEGLIQELSGRGDIEKKDNEVKMEDDIDATIDDMINGTRGLREKYAKPADPAVPSLVLREQKLLDLGLMFVKCGGRGDVPYGKSYLEAGLPVNFQHPVTGMTALHNACAHLVRPPDFVDMLLAVEDCDLLIRDKQGRIPYELAYRFNYDLDLVDRVEEKTREQAEREGVTIDWEFNEPSEPEPDSP